MYSLLRGLVTQICQRSAIQPVGAVSKSLIPNASNIFVKSIQLLIPKTYGSISPSAPLPASTTPDWREVSCIRLPSISPPSSHNGKIARSPCGYFPVLGCLPANAFPSPPEPARRQPISTASESPTFRQIPGFWLLPLEPFRTIRTTVPAPALVDGAAWPPLSHATTPQK